MKKDRVIAKRGTYKPDISLKLKENIVIVAVLIIALALMLALSFLISMQRTPSGHAYYTIPEKDFAVMYKYDNFTSFEQGDMMPNIAVSKGIKAVTNGQVFVNSTASEGEFTSITLTPDHMLWDLSGYNAASFDVTNLDDKNLTLGLDIYNSSSAYTHGNFYNIKPQETARILIVLRALESPIQRYGIMFPQPFAEFNENGNPQPYPNPFINMSNITKIAIFSQTFSSASKNWSIDNIRLYKDVDNESRYGKIVDKFGQYTKMNWTGKIYDEDELHAQGEQQIDKVQQNEYERPSGRDKYGGWNDTVVQNPSGYFRTSKINGRWVLVDPDGKIFFSIGMQGVYMFGRSSLNTYTQTDALDRRYMFEWLPAANDPLRYYTTTWSPTQKGYNFYAANVAREYGITPASTGYVPQEWIDVTNGRLDSWGFNTISNIPDKIFTDPSLPESKRRPYTLQIDSYGAPNNKIDIPGSASMSDPFDPLFSQGIKTNVNNRLISYKQTGMTDNDIINNMTHDPWLIGYYADNEMPFGTIIVTEALKQSKTPVKSAFVDYLKVKYASIGTFNSAWGVSLTSWDDANDTAIIPNMQKSAVSTDLSALLTLYAEKYFSGLNESIKSADPNHLYLGARFSVMPVEVVNACKKYCDVLSLNYYYTNVTFGSNTPLFGIDKPVIIGEFSFGTKANGAFNGKQDAGSQETVGNQYAKYLQSAYDSSYMVGVNWYLYADNMITGATYNENIQVGFVSVTDTPYAPLVSSATQKNSEVYTKLEQKWDLPYCGDASCNPDEDCSTCSQDCGKCLITGTETAASCGDRTCSLDENCSTCSQDCGECQPSLTNQVDLIDSYQNIINTYQTIQKCMNAINPGQSCLVHEGIYRETVSITKSGLPDSPITLMAAPEDRGKAIIDSADELLPGNWTKCISKESCGNNDNWANIYYASLSFTIGDNETQLFQNGIRLNSSRYPDKGWFQISQLYSDKSFSSAALANTGRNLANAISHNRMSDWMIDYKHVSRYDRNSNTINLSNNVAAGHLTYDYGFFLTNVIEDINQEGEWAYDYNNNKIYVWPVGGSTSGLEATRREDGILFTVTQSNIIINGLEIKNSAAKGIDIARNSNVTIKNNVVSYSGSVGIYAVAGSSINITNNTVKYANKVGINTGESSTDVSIERNHVYATGAENYGDDLNKIYGYGIEVSGNHTAVIYNTVDRTAYNGIFLNSAYRTNNTVAYNNVTECLLSLTDGGCIYTIAGTSYGSYDYIYRNIIANSYGYRGGVKNDQCNISKDKTRCYFAGAGIYLDNYTNHVIVSSNTVVNCSQGGIFFHLVNNNNVTDNLIYSAGMQILLMGTSSFSDNNNNVYRNLMLSATPAQSTYDIRKSGYLVYDFGNSDNNVFFNPYQNKSIVLNNTNHTDLQGWKELSSKDSNSKDANSIPYVTNNANNSMEKDFFVLVNPTEQQRTFALNEPKCDIENNVVSTQATLAPYSSKALLNCFCNNDSACNNKEDCKTCPQDCEVCSYGQTYDYVTFTNFDPGDILLNFTPSKTIVSIHDSKVFVSYNESLYSSPSTYFSLRIDKQGQTFNWSQYDAVTFDIENLEDKPINGIALTLNKNSSVSYKGNYVIGPLKKERLLLTFFDPDEYSTQLGLQYSQPFVDMKEKYNLNVGGDESNISYIQVFVGGMNQSQFNSQSHNFSIDNIRLYNNIDGQLRYTNLTDKFGQYTKEDWPGKIYSMEQLQQEGINDTNAIYDYPPDRDMYQGWSTGPKIANPSGFFRAQKVNSRWVLITPNNTIFFEQGMQGVGVENINGYDSPSYRTLIDQRLNGPLLNKSFMFQDLPVKNTTADPIAYHYQSYYKNSTYFNDYFFFYSANIARKYNYAPSSKSDFPLQWFNVTRNRMKSWGFSGYSATIDGRLIDPRQSPSQRMPYLLEFSSSSDTPIAVYVTSDRTDTLGDPFDSSFEQKTADSMKARINSTVINNDPNYMEYIKNDPFLIGYFVDNERNYGGLTDTVLKLNGTPTPIKAKFVERLKYIYGGDFQSFNATWQLKGGQVSWSDLNSTKIINSSATQAVINDKNNLTYYFAETYFSKINKTIKSIDPNHMFLGSRFGIGKEATGNNIVLIMARACSIYCDVMSYNYYFDNVTDTGFLDFLNNNGVDKPMIIGEYTFSTTAHGEFFPYKIFRIDRGVNYPYNTYAAMQYDSEAGKAEGFVSYLNSAIDNQNVVGINWYLYNEQPFLSSKGVDTGFLTITDSPEHPLVDYAKQANWNMYSRMQSKWMHLGCGDGFCYNTDQENCSTCQADCNECFLPCGNGVCDQEETCVTCFEDCGACDMTPPRYSSLKNHPATAAAYIPGQQYQFNVTWTDDIGIDKVTIEHNFSGTLANYSVATRNGNEYHYSHDTLGAGIYRWKEYANDTYSNLNSTGLNIYTVSPASTAISLTLNGNNNDITLTYPQPMTAIFTTNALTANMYRNGTQINTQNNTPTILAAGSYNYTAINLGNQNYTGSRMTHLATISKGLSTCILSFDKTSPQTYGTAITPICVCHNPESTSRIYLDGTDATAQNNQPTIFGAGTHIFICNTTETQNYSQSTSTNMMTIDQATTATSLTLNGNNNDILLVYPQTIIAVYSTNALTANMYRNGTQINAQNNIPMALGAGSYNYTAINLGNQNYTGSRMTHLATISKANNPVTLTLNGGTSDLTIEYGMQTTVIATAAGGTANIYKDGILKSSGASPQSDTTILAVGTYNYKANSTGNQNYTDNATGLNHNIIVNKATPTCLLTLDKSSPQGYGAAITPTCTCSQGTTRLYRNGIDVTTAENATAKTLAAGTHTYICNTTQTQNFTNAAATQAMTVNKAATACSLAFDKTTPQTYGTQINATCSCTNTETPAALYKDGLNANAENRQLVTSAAGNHNYECNATQTQNYTSSSNISSFAISQATPNINYLLNNNAANITVVYPTQANASGSTNAGTLNIYRNGTLITNGANYTLGAGYYKIEFNVTGNQNYTNAQKTLYATITKASSVLTLNANPGWVTIDGAQTTASCTANNNEADIRLYRNATYIGNSIGGTISDTQTLNIGSYNYTCNSTGTQNYTSAALSHILEITSKTVSRCNLTFTPSSGSMHPVTVNASCRCSNTEANAILYRDGTDVTATENNKFRALAAGTYVYECNVTQTQSYSYASNTSSYLISKAATATSMTLNGNNNDITLTYPQPMTAIFTTNALTANMYRNGTQINTQNNTPTILAVGSYNYTATNTGNQNYTESRITHLATISKATAACTLTFDKTAPQVYGTAITPTCTCNSPETTARLYLDNTDATAQNTQPMILATGTHTYTCNATQTQNYTQATRTQTMTINRAATACTLTFDKTAPQAYGTAITPTCTCNSPETTARLYLDSIDATAQNTQPAILAAETHIYTCNATQTQNYTSASNTSSFAINKAMPAMTLTASADTAVYGTQTTMICSVNTAQAAPKLYRNNSYLGSSFETTTLSAGTHNYTCNTTETQNYTDVQQSKLITINKAIPTITKKLNGADSSATITYPSALNASGSAMGGILHIYLNGTDITAQNNLGIILAAGSYQYKFNATGNQNYTDLAGDTLDADVLKAGSQVYTHINGSRQDIVIAKGISIMLNGTLAQGQGDIYLYRDSQLLAQGSPKLSASQAFTDYGYYNITTAYPATQNYTSSSETFFVNVTSNVPPQATIISPVDKIYNQTQILVDISAPDADNVWYNTGEANITYAGPLTVAFNQGTNNLTVYANDSIGNLGVKKVSFFIDSLSPSLSIISPQERAYSESTQLLNISAEDTNLDKTWYLWNGQSAIYENPASIEAILGSNMITAFANDTAGNIASRQAVFSIVLPYCGDASCNADENCIACSQDCGACSCTENCVAITDNEGNIYNVSADSSFRVNLTNATIRIGRNSSMILYNLTVNDSVDLNLSELLLEFEKAGTSYAGMRSQQWQYIKDNMQISYTEIDLPQGSLNTVFKCNDTGESCIDATSAISIVYTNATNTLVSIPNSLGYSAYYGIYTPPPASCGNGACDSTENCDICPGDCGACPPTGGGGGGGGGGGPVTPFCGNKRCEANETCMACSKDCGNCTGTPMATTTLATTTTITSMTKPGYASTTQPGVQEQPIPDLPGTDEGQSKILSTILIYGILLAVLIMILVSTVFYARREGLKRKIQTQVQQPQEREENAGPFTKQEPATKIPDDAKMQIAAATQLAQVQIQPARKMTFAEEQLSKGKTQQQILEAFAQKFKQYAPESIYELNAWIVHAYHTGMTKEEILQKTRDEKWDEKIVSFILNEGSR